MTNTTVAKILTELKKNEMIVLAAVKSNFHALEYADPELKKNERIVLEAVKSNATIGEISDTLRNVFDEYKG